MSTCLTHNPLLLLLFTAILQDLHCISNITVKGFLLDSEIFLTEFCFVQAKITGPETPCVYIRIYMQVCMRE